jgi:hypothetical protein
MLLSLWWKSLNLQTLCFKQGGMVATLWIHIWEVLGLNLGQDIGNPEGFCGFSQSLQANVGIVPE